MLFTRASKALARFTVLDLTRVRAGPTCVRQLADWGAPPPDLGEHTDAILKEFGFKAVEIAALRKTNAI